MITVAKTEHEELLQDAGTILLEAAYRSLDAMEQGYPLSRFARELQIKHAGLEALRGYKTGKYQPEEEYNIISPDQVSAIYHLITT